MAAWRSSATASARSNFFTLSLKKAARATVLPFLFKSEKLAMLLSSEQKTLEYQALSLDQALQLRIATTGLIV